MSNLAFAPLISAANVAKSLPDLRIPYSRISAVEPS